MVPGYSISPPTSRRPIWSPIANRLRGPVRLAPSRHHHALAQPVEERLLDHEPLVLISPAHEILLQLTTQSFHLFREFIIIKSPAENLTPPVEIIEARDIRVRGIGDPVPAYL